MQEANKAAVILATLEQLARTRAPQKWLLWMGTASMVRDAPLLLCS